MPMFSPPRASIPHFWRAALLSVLGLWLLGQDTCEELCDDSDLDGICNEQDICPAGDDLQDADGDGIPDACEDIVSVQGTSFQVNGQPFHFLGTNNYYLMTWAADPSLQADVDEVIADAALLGLNVIRLWPFNDGESWNAVQPQPGVYDETVLQGLDYVLARCGELGIRVILPFVNNWDDYGGMNQYVAWSPTASSHDDFYTDGTTQADYQAFVAMLIGRQNTVTGRFYRDDPTIFAWELANEPRCPSDPSGDTLVAWIDTMGRFVKSLDPNHLLTVGSEGFYDDDIGPWYLDGSEGVDFLRDHAVESIDFATAHLYPDNWGVSQEATLTLLDRQIADAAEELQKPFILEEFGLLRDQAGAPMARSTPQIRRIQPAHQLAGPPLPVQRWPLDKSGLEIIPASARPPAAIDLSAEDTRSRDQFFADCFDRIHSSASGGALFWILYHDTYPDYDGYGVYYPTDESTSSVILDYAALLAGL